jgi:hypothetical protein
MLISICGHGAVRCEKGNMCITLALLFDQLHSLNGDIPEEPLPTFHRIWRKLAGDLRVVGGGGLSHALELFPAGVHSLDKVDEIAYCVCGLDEVRRRSCICISFVSHSMYAEPMYDEVEEVHGQARAVRSGL